MTPVPEISRPSDNAQEKRHRRLWRKTNSRLLPLGIAALLGAGIAAYYGGLSHTLNHRILTWAGVALFALSTVACLHVFTHTTKKVVAHYMGARRASGFIFFLRVAGYLFVFFCVLGLLRIPIEKLLLGSAVTGIIIGVAAQQSLANFFASIVLLITRPYSVGDRIDLKSGGLGDYTGMVADIGLTHTRLLLDNGQSALLPNATVLSGAAIIPLPPEDSGK